MAQFFYHVSRWIQNHKLWSCFLAIGFVIACFFTISKIHFEEDITQMLPKQAMQNETAKIWKNVRFQDKIAVIVSKKETTSSDDLIDTANALIDTLSVADEYIASIQGQTSEDVMEASVAFVQQHLPLYLEPADYDSISERISALGIEKQMQKNVETLLSGATPFWKDLVVKDPLQMTFLALPHLQESAVDTQYDFQDGFLFTKDGKHLVFFIQPKMSGSETEKNEELVTILNQIKDQFHKQYTKTEISYFGSSFIAVANAQQIKTDILTTISLSMTTLMIILMLYYRRIIIPILVFLPSVLGGITALACMYFITGSLSAISISISAILLGITIDYALHFLTHSKAITDSKTLFKEITRPLFMSSFTTAIAFLCLLFVDAKALNDLGWFAFIAVLASAFFTLIILPQVYKPKKALETSHFIDRLAKYPFEKNKALIAFCLILVIGSIFTYHKVSFDQDLTKINFFPKEQADSQKLIEPKQQNTKTLYVVNYGKNEEQVLQQTKKIQQISAKDRNVLAVNSIAPIVLDLQTQTERLNRWKNFWKEHNHKLIENRLVQASIKQGFVEETFSGFASGLEEQEKQLTLSDFEATENPLLEDFISKDNEGVQISTIVKIPDDYRNVFLQKMASEKNTVVIDRQALNEELLGHLVNDFNDLVNYSFLAVILILWYFFRRLELVILAAIPIGLTGFITAGIMGALGIPFNIFSSIVCTLIFGHGVDFTIFMTSALQKQYTYARNEMPIYRTSIILAVLTTVLAIGALIFAQHPALKSISSIALIGVCTAVLITFVLYPILFAFFIENRPKKGLSPVSLRIALESIISFAIFGVGGILISSFLRIFQIIAPVSKTTKIKVMGKGMSFFMAFILWLKPWVKKRLIQKQYFDKKRQTIIISNHTSFLDSLAVGQYHPYIIYLVNDWVVRSPFFGRFSKSFGFYPVKEGAEGSAEQIQKRIGSLSSVVVFPEGTRSYSHEIGRFHKGAFYLAGELKMPIQPIHLHGISEVIPKGDFMIYDGHIFNVVEPIIEFDDASFGEMYTERTKKISRQFKTRFAEIRKEFEGVDYYKQKLFFNYLYKEQEIVQLVKRDFKKNKEAYLELNHLLPEKGKFVHITTDVGQTDFLLLKHGPSRKLLTVIENEDHRDVASASYITKVRSVHYFQSYNEIQVTNSDTLLISHNANVSDEISFNYKKVVCFLASQTIPKGMTCTYNSQNIQVYERN